MLQVRDLDLNLLVVFQEVFQERQISAAARHLNLSQPAVSNALARLRRTCNDELFVRTALGMQPTPFAEQLAEPVSLALAQLGRALNREQEFDPAASEREFTIAMTDVGEVYFMPVLTELCESAAPRIRIATVRAGSLDLNAEMAAGRVDLAVGAFDDAASAWYQRRLFKQHYVSMFRRGHALDGGKAGLKEFQAARHLIVASLDSPYDKINQKLQQAGLRGAFTVPHFVAVPYIVGGSDLVVTVPQKLAERAAAPFDLVYMRPPLRLPALQTNVFWHRRYNQDAGNQWLRGFIADHFSE